jgi:hypothetical protein
MDVIIIESEAYWRLVEQQTEFILAKLKQNQKEDNSKQKDWITLSEAQRILPYKSRTKWQELRDRGEIVFAKFGRKILYRKSSIEIYIQNKISKS